MRSLLALIAASAALALAGCCTVTVHEHRSGTEIVQRPATGATITGIGSGSTEAAAEHSAFLDAKRKADVLGQPDWILLPRGGLMDRNVERNGVEYVVHVTFDYRPPTAAAPAKPTL